MKKELVFSVFLVMCVCVANALNFTDTKEEICIYERNKNDIDSMLFYRVPEKMAEISHYYVIPKDENKRLRNFVREREFKLICQDFLYRDSFSIRIKNKIDIEELYRDSIFMILIPICENNISGDNLSYALSCKKYLELDSAQYNYLMGKALDIAKRLRKNRKTNVWNEEMEILKKCLSKNQLWSFFTNKNSVKVTNEYDRSWQKIKNHNLIEQLDSVNDTNEALTYMFKKQMIKDLYKNWGTSQKRYLSELDKNKPKMIQLLDSIAKGEIKERQNRYVTTKLVW